MTARARRIAETFRELALRHSKTRLVELAEELERDFVRRGVEVTPADEKIAIEAAAETFRNEEVHREDDGRTREAGSQPSAGPGRPTPRRGSR